MNLKQGLLGIPLIVIALIASTPAYGTRWVYLGNNDNTDYYVDVESERIKGSLWAAPIRAEAPDTTYLGEVVVDCSDITYQIQFGNQVYDWQPIEPTSPLSTIVKQVCN
jgi:hypothetical protein